LRLFAALDLDDATRTRLASVARDHWTLYQSQTRPDGAVYTPLATWRLG
jgi:2'-5' RNA ligase